MQPSNIEWTDYTWNPTSGCTKVSAGCKHCYAEANVERFKGNSVAYPNGFNLTLKPHKLREPLSKRLPPSKIFVNSMSDLFHQDVPDSYIDEVLEVVKKCPQHTFQVLTKRPERMMEYFEGFYDCDCDGCSYGNADCRKPLPNLWLGTSVENRATLDRLRWIGKTNAAVRFASFEPLLEDISDWRLGKVLGDDFFYNDRPIDWAIIGGESGRDSRPCEVDWIGKLLGCLTYYEIPVFVKQLGEHWSAQRRAQGIKTDRRGGNPDEWPASLRVRQFPGVGWEIVCDLFAGGGGASKGIESALGLPITCGNSVCPQVAEALVRANVRLREVAREELPLTGGLFG